MIRSLAIIRESARHAAMAAGRAVEALRERRIEQEPAFTDRMLGYIEGSMEGFRIKGVSWRAKTFTDRGPRSQESRVGADFARVLHIRIRGYEVNKGFLAQAKLVEPNDNIPTTEYDRLQQQTAKMLIPNCNQTSINRQ